jgi:hypothetical protein
MTSVNFVESVNAKLRPIWDIASDSPFLFEALCRDYPWAADSYRRIKDDLPVPSTAAPFVSGRTMRPPMHKRCFYMLGQEGDSIHTIAVKGTEILARDVLKEVADLRYPHASMRTVVDYFPNRERKVPFALRVREALAESSAADKFQTAYVKRYREFAKIPVPLLVFKWSTEEVQKFVDSLHPQLAPHSAKVVADLVSEGLAVYVYFYPGLSNRVREFCDTLRSRPFEGFEATLLEMKEHLDVEEVIGGWIKLMARMLTLGFLPSNLATQDVGQLVQVQNAVIDGGFVDCDSLQTISEVGGETEVQFTLALGLFELASTVHSFLLQKFRPFRSVGPYSFTSTLLFDWVLNRLRAEVANEQKSGAEIHPWIARVIEREQGFESLMEIFAAAYPQRQSGHL